MAEASKLETEVAEARRTISSDGYPMSIGELTNLYRDGELKIRPEFQRFFRWSSTQKSRLVESILLGIPLPSIFVAQTEKGTWELVDGLQRVSTILELQGELLDSQGKQVPPLQLEGTKYLPSLAGRVWMSDDTTKSLNEAQRLDVKRAKLDLKIIKRESSAQAKYDLFQRLNSYGSTLNSQELRSALVVAASPEFFSWMERLSTFEPFVESTQLSDKLIDERFDLELVSRFIVLYNWPENRLSLSALRDLPQLLDDEIVKHAISSPAGIVSIEKIFKKTFEIINASGGEKIFRRWDNDKNEFVGSFLISAFEVFALGIGYHLAAGSKYKTNLIDTAKQFWQKPHMKKGYATGRSTEARLVQFVPEGRELLRSES